MAGARKDSRLGSRTARVALKARHQPYWINIAEGVALGYRRGPQGGSWYARVYAGEGQYQQAQIGGADDHVDANAETVLTFYQAPGKGEEARTITRPGAGDRVVVRPDRGRGCRQIPGLV